MKIELGKTYQTNEGREMLIVANVAQIAKARKLDVWDLYDKKLFIAVEIKQNLSRKFIDADIPEVFDSKGKGIMRGDFLIEQKPCTQGML